MQNNKLSVSRNGNQSGPRATRPESGGGGDAVAGECPVTSALGTGAESPKGPRAGRAQAKDQRVTIDSEFSGTGVATRRTRRVCGEATSNEAVETEGLTSRSSSSTVRIHLPVELAALKERTFTSPIYTVDSVLSMEAAPTTDDRSTVDNAEENRIHSNIAPVISTDPSTQNSGSAVVFDDAAENYGVFYLCEGVEYVDPTAMLEP